MEHQSQCGSTNSQLKPVNGIQCARGIGHERVSAKRVVYFIGGGVVLKRDSLFGILSGEERTYVTDTIFTNSTSVGAESLSEKDEDGPSRANPVALTSKIGISNSSPFLSRHFTRYTGASSKGGTCKEYKPDALSAALDRLTSSLNSDGTLPLSTFERIVKELSSIEGLQSMLLFRPNKKKGKGGRQPAKDPRLDPTVDPRKAKRIVANRISAARSKQKQKRHVESLQLEHDTLMIQMLLCKREKEKLQAEIDSISHDNQVLETELQALNDHVQRVRSQAVTLVAERDALKARLESDNK